MESIVMNECAIIANKMVILCYRKYLFEMPITIFLFIWQFPQNLAGLILLIILTFLKGITHREYYHHKYIFFGPKCPAGLSLGIFVFVQCSTTKAIIIHELGHCKQSEILGPLYLLLVGIPSLTMNLLSQHNERVRSRYYQRFPENWADRLGEKILVNSIHPTVLM